MTTVSTDDKGNVKTSFSPPSADRGRPRDDTRPKDWSPYGTAPTSQPKATTKRQEKPSATPLKNLRDAAQSNTQKTIRDVFSRAGKVIQGAKAAKAKADVDAWESKALGKKANTQRGYNGEPLRKKGDEKYVSRQDYRDYKTGQDRRKKDDEASRIAEAQRRAAAGEPLRAKGEEKRYVSQAEYNAYQTAKAKAKKKGR